MKKQSITIQCNKQIVGNNSKSYNDKHPENPISLRPLHDAIASTAEILDSQKRFVQNHRAVRFLRQLGNLPRPYIAALVNTKIR